MTTLTTTTDLLEALNDWTTRYNDPTTRDAIVGGGANWFEDIVCSGDFDHLVDWDAMDRHEDWRNRVFLTDGTVIDGDRGPKAWFIVDHDTTDCEDCQ